MPHFIPSASPSPEDNRTLFVVFRNGAVFSDAGTVLHESLEALPGVTQLRTAPLGTYDGRPVSAIEVDSDDPRFVSLRSVLMSASTEMMRVVALGSQLLHFHATHAFCGRCGTATIDKANERAKSCPTCSLDVYPRVSPAMIVLIHDGDKLLLAHRPNMPYFALVAGFLESGETLEECVAREVMEEVGLEITDIRYFGSQPWPFPHQIMVGFWAKASGGAIKVDGVELDDAKFFRRGELPPLPPFVSIARQMIDAFLEERTP